MANWVRIAAVAECPPESSREFVVADRIVALFHVGDRFYALDGVCPHQGGPLGQGHLNGCILTCPWHGWQFDVTNGRHQLNKNYRQPTFGVKVEADAVFVDLDESPPAT